MSTPRSCCWWIGRPSRNTEPMTSSHCTCDCILRASVWTIWVFLLSEKITCHEMARSNCSSHGSAQYVRKSIRFICSWIQLWWIRSRAGRSSLLIVRIFIVVYSWNLGLLFAFTRSKYGLWPTTFGSLVIMCITHILFWIGSHVHVLSCSVRQVLGWEHTILLLLLTTCCRNLFCGNIAIEVTQRWSCFTTSRKSSCWILSGIPS
jgi:hypothetical protein